MKHDASVSGASTGFAVFDAHEKFLAGNPAFLELSQDEIEKLTGKTASSVLKPVIQRFKTVDGAPVRKSAAFQKSLIARWSSPDGLPFEVETADNHWKLMTSHPRPGGGVAFISADITELKLDQLEKLENEEIYRCITDTHPLPVWMVDEETAEIVYETIAASELLGRMWDPDQPQFITDHYVNVKDRARVKRLLTKHGEVTDFELQMQKRDGEKFWISANVRRGTYHGRPVLISGIVDITERKEREDLFGFLVENHPMPVWMNDGNTGDVIFQSPAAAKLFGWDVNDPEEHRHMRNHFVEPEQYDVLSKRLRDEMEIENYEAVLKDKDGREFWVIGNIRRTEYNGQEVVISGIADVSSQKQREDHFRFLLESHPMPVWANDAETGEVLHKSAAADRLFSAGEDDGSPNYVNEFFCDPEANKEIVRRLASDGQLEGYEVEAITGDGRKIWVTGNAALLEYDGRKVVLGGIMDVTDQKRREKETADARRMLADAIESLSEGFALYDEDGKLVMCNTSYREVNAGVADLLQPGLSWEDLMRASASRGIYADAIGREQEWIEARLENGIEFIKNYQLAHADGSWHLISIHPTDIGGFVVTRTDITEQKEREQEIIETRNLLHDAIESLSEGFALYGPDDGLVMANSRYREMHAQCADKLVPGVNWFDFLRVTAERQQFPVPPDEIDDWLAERARDRSEYRQHEFEHTDGNWYHVSTNPTHVGGFVVTRLDITERKRLEEERRKADAVVRQVLDSCPVPIQMSKIGSGAILYRNPSHWDLMGEKETARDYFKDQKEREDYIRELMKNGEMEEYQGDLINASGEPFPATYSARLLEFEGEQVIVSAIRDETERMAAQEEVRLSNELMHDAIESLTEGFALYDDQECLVMCNQNYREMNKSAADLLQPGMEWKALMHHFAEDGEFFDAPDRADEWIEERTSGDRERLSNYELQRSDGRWFAVSSNPTRQGGFVVTRSDITERKLMEEAQRQSDAVVRQVLDACPIPIQMSTVETAELLYRSPAHYALFGEVEDGRDYYINPDDRLEYIKRLNTVGVVDDFEVELYNASKEPVWVSISARLIEFQGETVVVSNSLDLTDRVRAEEETRHAKERLTDAIDSLSEGFALFDKDHKLVMCNERYVEMNPLLRDKIVPGTEYFDLLSTGGKRGQYTDAIGRVEDWLAERRRGAVITERRYDFQTSDGHWYSGARRPTRDGGFVITRVDITERKAMEEAQREADAVVRQLVNACPTALEMRRIVDGEFLFRSPAAVEMLGEREDLAATYASPQDQVDLHRDLEASGEVIDRRIRLRNGNGDQFWASVSAAYADFRGHKVVVSTISDLTERVAVEEESRRAHQLLRDAIESLQEGFILYDAEHRLVMCNSLFRQMNPLNGHLHKPGAKLDDLLEAAIESGQFSTEAANWGLPDGNPWKDTRIQGFEFQQSDGRWYSAAISPTREGGFVATRTDITEQKKMQELKREADEMVRRVLEACTATIQMTRARDGKVLYQSPATVELFGKAETSHEHYLDPADRDRFAEEIKNSGLVDDFEVQMKRTNGETCWVSVSGRLIEFQGEDVVVSNAYDLTDRITMQEELNRQREILHQSEKLSALGELLAGVAHELNNPLSVVVGQSLMLTETAQDEKIKARAEKIGNAADRCARIVKTFLAMARQQPAQTTNVNVNDVVESSLEVAGYALRTSGVALALRLTPDLPAVWGDPDQLNQIFINLIVNAEQALRGWSGPKRVKIVSRYDTARNDVVVKIHDSGPGIPENVRSRIFEPFFTTKEVGEGTGIGLAFCHRIVETHGGSIRVECKPGQGTAFFVRLPASSRLDESADKALEKPGQEKKTQVLVIDDEADVADLIAEILRSDGHDVTVANSGADALRKIQRESFAVILSDLKMANLDGPSLFAKLKEHYPQLTQRVGFITGDTMSPKARAFLDASQRPFLEKPIRPNELRDLFSSLLETDKV
ncbi:MAG: PAS-domain containing protein [Pseudomonadota bacterium]